MQHMTKNCCDCLLVRCACVPALGFFEIGDYRINLNESKLYFADCGVVVQYDFAKENCERKLFAMTL
jgi:hypothetical protein